jgi:hypothetical protein
MSENRRQFKADRTRRLLLAGIAGAVVLPAVGCAAGGSSRRYRDASVPGPRWPELPSRGVLERRHAERTAPPRVERTPEAVFHRRSEWATNGVIPRRMDRMRPVQRVTIHHDGMPPVALRSARDVASRIDLIRQSHQKRGWGDIGYHYIVDPRGEVWEGRPLSWQGAHVANQNPGNMGVLVLGNFEAQAPTGQQLDALDRFVASRLDAYGLSLGSVYTHQELAPTACPGRHLQRHMSRTRGPRGRLAMLASAGSLG